MSTPHVHVLNPQGKDKFQEFATKRQLKDPSGHAPINFHAYPAATKGCFAQFTNQLFPLDGIVIVLLRKRLGRSIKAIKKLNQEGFTVWISWKEAGHHQIASAMTRMGNKKRLKECIHLCDGIVCPSPAAREFFKAFGHDEKPLIDLPTPYPVDHSAWQLPPAHDEQKGIMIGTREFDVPSRNHAKAIGIAAEVARRLKVRLTVISPKGSKSNKLIIEACEKLPRDLLNIVQGPLPYREYLQLIADHKLAFQLDTSAVPGQVAGDCLLADTLCVGGNGEIERIAFSALHDKQGDTKSHDWNELLSNLLSDEKSRLSALRNSRDIAASTLSFSAFRQRLRSIAPKQK